MADQLRNALEILRRKQVEQKTGLPRSTLYDRIRDKTFPAPISLGGRSVGWRQSDVEKWLENPAGYRAGQ
ncbi:helix-turn-helix transcriptional regulator [Cupriavidus metallidurans]|uniref:helix-turn-helix transcriptional regulator n=1 Tax=Cupriavidus metallidurans TaxID=119219 RepID=UPI003CFD1427